MRVLAPPRPSDAIFGPLARCFHLFVFRLTVSFYFLHAFGGAVLLEGSFGLVVRAALLCRRSSKCVLSELSGIVRLHRRAGDWAMW